MEAVTAARAAHDRITDSALTSGRMGSDDTILTILAHTQADLVRTLVLGSSEIWIPSDRFHVAGWNGSWQVNVIPIPLDNYCYPLEQALSDRGPPFDSSQRVKLRGGYDLRGVTCDLWEYLDEDERQRVGTPVQWQVSCCFSAMLCNRSETA